MKTSDNEKLKKDRRRYYLHYRLRKNDYKVNTQEKTIFVNYLKQNEHSDIVTLYIKELSQTFGYGIQTSLN